MDFAINIAFILLVINMRRGLRVQRGRWKHPCVHMSVWAVSASFLEAESGKGQALAQNIKSSITFKKISTHFYDFSLLDEVQHRKFPHSFLLKE